MPQLIRLRFINLGHENARTTDLIVPLHDKTGYAADSVIWARNGGGKSMLLSLFLALINPHQKRFLGSITSQGIRRFEDYVPKGSRAILIAEWQSDEIVDGFPVRYLTGYFCEWKQEGLVKLFFASRVSEPDITFETIPVKTENGEWLTLYSFSHAWQNLAKKHPAAESHETKSQKNWYEILEGARIDPELFNYQITMNSEEGGAGKLFSKFNSSNDFVDFFIKMVMSSNQYDEIGKQLEAFRQRAAEYKSWQAELSLIEALKLLIAPLIDAAVRRQAHREHISGLQSRVRHLQRLIETHQTTNERRIIETAEFLSAAKSSAERFTKEAQFHNERNSSFERRFLERRATRTSSEQQELEKKLREAAHSYLLWKSARSFSDVARLEKLIRSLEEDLQTQTTEFATDWDKVHASAQNLANALLARAEENERLAKSKNDEAANRRKSANEARRKSNDAHSKAGSFKNEAKNLANRIEQAQTSRTNLEADETLAPNESTESGLERHQERSRNIGQKEESLTAEIEKADQLLERLAAEADNARQESVKAQQLRDEAQRIIQNAVNHQNKVLAIPILKRLFGEVDREILNRVTIDSLRQERAAVESKWRKLSVAIAESELVLEYLQENNLLPPTRDVQTVLKVLRGKDKNIAAFPGWRHVADIFGEREKSRAFISAHPEIALGVIVIGKDFETAKSILSENHPSLSTAVVVASRDFVDNLDTESLSSPTSDIAKRFVVGPSSDAHFDRTAAKNEKAEFESRLQSGRVEREKAAEDEKEIRNAANDLQQFIEKYPPDWFERKEAELRAAETYYQECLAEIVRIENQRTETRESLNRQRENLRETLVDKSQTEEYLRRLNRHLELFGTDAQLRETAVQQTAFEAQAANLAKEAESFEIISESEREQARQFDDEARKYKEIAESDAEAIHNVKHLKGEASPVSGDVDALQARHQTLCESIDQKTGAESIRVSLKSAEASLNEARKRFDDEREEAIIEDEIRRALEETPDKSAIKMRISEADNRKSELQKLIGKAESETENAKKELKQHQSKNLQFKSALTAEESDFTEDELESRASAARSAEETARTQIARFTDETERRKRELEQAESMRRELKSQSARLEILADNEVFTEVVETLAIESTAINDYEDYLQGLEKNVQEAGKLRTNLIEQRDEIHKRILVRLENEPFDFVRPLKGWSVDYFEVNAQKALDDLETREKTIRADLEQAGAYRKAIVEQLLGAAERGITLLREIANSSKLPESAGNLAGRNFLQIKLELPESRAEKSERIGNLIDDIIRQEKMPEIIEIIQRAVRKVPVGGIDVRVLFPDVNDFKPRYRPITMISAESGGEHLTSTVLIYCALTRLRAKERGSNPKASSVLLLDNPFGKVTRRVFIELQREMARAMNVQLVYLTGDDSREALSVFPNRVRMRNERRDRATGEYLLELVQIVQNEK